MPSMKRRSFFKVFAVAAAAAAAPSIVLADAKSAAWTTPGAAIIGDLTEWCWFNIDTMTWQVLYYYLDRKTDTVWEYTRLIDSTGFNGDPAHDAAIVRDELLPLFRYDAGAAIQRAITKNDMALFGVRA